MKYVFVNLFFRVVYVSLSSPNNINRGGFQHNNNIFINIKSKGKLFRRFPFRKLNKLSLHFRLGVNYLLNTREPLSLSL